MRTSTCLLLLAACTSPPWDPDTLVDELRVVAVVGSPPEAEPGDDVVLEAHVMDPADGPFDLLTWFCTPFGGTCLEASGPAFPLDTFTAVVTDAALVERVAFTVPEAVRELLPPELPAAPVTLWTLACRPGLCPVIDQVAAAPAPGTPAWQDAVAELASPGGWLRDVPMIGVSLAVKTLVVSTRPDVEKNRNPGCERPDDGPIEVAPGSVTELAFEVGEGTVHAFTTAGAFTEPVFGAGGLALVRWYAPALPGDVDLLVVVEDGVGGTSVWRRTATVR